MAAGFYVALNSRTPGFDANAGLGGHALAELPEGVLSAACRSLSVPDLVESFASMSPEELCETDVDPRSAREKWYAPEAGLVTVRALRKHFTFQPGALDVVTDLEAMELVLLQAAARGLLWHLARAN